MVIDWFTVGMQLINFVILMWLLKRFLYKPILNAIDEREQGIAKELADADAQRNAAQQERDEFQRKNDEFDRQRADLMTRAADEAKAERLRLFEQVRKAADVLGSNRQETLQADARTLNQSLAQRTQQEVFAIARKTLSDLAGASLEGQIAEVFLCRLRGLNAEEKKTLVATNNSSADPAIVRTAFDLTAAQRESTESVLHELFGAETRVRFETAPDLISGIELTLNGQKIAWSIASYLGSMQQTVEDLIGASSKPAADARPEPAGSPLEAVHS